MSSSDVMREMGRAVNALALELPASVHEDVVRRWRAVYAEHEALRERVTTLESGIEKAADRLEPDGEPWYRRMEVSILYGHLRSLLDVSDDQETT